MSTIYDASTSKTDFVITDYYICWTIIKNFCIAHQNTLILSSLEISAIYLLSYANMCRGTESKNISKREHTSLVHTLSHIVIIMHIFYSFPWNFGNFHKTAYNITRKKEWKYIRSVEYSHFWFHTLINKNKR